MKLKMYLIRIIGKSFSVNEQTLPNSFCIADIKCLDDESDYANFVQREDLSEEGKPYVTQTHYAVTGIPGFYVPAFEILPEKGETTDCCELRYGQDTNNTFTLTNQKIVVDGKEISIFFDMPRGKYKKEQKNGEGVIYYEYEKDEQKSALGAIQPGFTNIYIYKNGELIGKRELQVLPSGLNTDEMMAMIDELYFMRRELVSFDFKEPGKYFLHAKYREFTERDSWPQALIFIEKRLDELAKFLRKIERNLHGELITINEYVATQKLKKIDANIVRQYVKNPSRNQYCCQGAYFSDDIYEHRLLYTKLQSLKHFVEKETQVHNKLLEGKKRTNTLNMGIFTDSNTHSIEKLTEQVNNIIKRGGADFDRSAAIMFTSLCQTRDVSVVYTSKMFQSCVCIRDNLNTGISGVYLDIRPIWINGKTDYRFQITFNDTNESSKRYYIHTVRIAVDDFRLLLMIYGELSKEGKNHIDHTIKMSGRLYGIQTQTMDKYTVWAFVFTKINSIWIDDVPIEWKNMDIDIARQSLRNIYVTSLIDDKYIFPLSQVKALSNERTWLDSRHADDTEAQNKIAVCLSSKLFRKYEGKAISPEPWRMTQIFTNDRNYHAAYSLLKNMDKILDFSVNYDSEKIFHKKMDKIYEYWLLAKILETLIVIQRWEPIDEENSPSRFIDRIIQEKFQGIPIKLQRYGKNSKLLLELYYDTELKDSLTQNSSNLRPDYLFKITNESQSITKYFILDAKYRNYQAQGKKEWLNEDMVEICADKYIRRIESETGIKISAAFIVHSDGTPHVAGIGNTTAGRYVTFNARSNPECKNELNSRLSAVTYRGDLYQVGSFYMLPVTSSRKENFSQEHIITFFSLIFEFFFGETHICWHCGSDDVNTKFLSTIGGFSKTHIRCKSCGAFWVATHDKSCRGAVKLIKHLFNYHTEANNQIWHVFCPRCEANQTGDSHKAYLSNTETASEKSLQPNSNDFALGEDYFKSLEKIDDAYFC